MPTLFDPIVYGRIECKNRVVLAPLTRARSTIDSVPTDIMVQYYAQRADFGLIISEATGINRPGLGWPYAPGIWNKEQVEAWKPITKAVHEKGGKIVCQLWHMGRLVHPEVTGCDPLSASDTTFEGRVRTYHGKVQGVPSREMTLEEVKQTVRDFRDAAINSIAAGFDGVQIHATNGYLIHQFLSEKTNHRKDEYGGSLENRLRFLKEIVTAVTDAIGADRTGIRFSPNNEIQGTFIDFEEIPYAEISDFLNEKNIAFVALRENVEGQPHLGQKIRSCYKGKLIINQDFTREKALKEVESQAADAVSFGRLTISNTDFVEKLRANIHMTPRKNEIQYWYEGTAEGYTYWPEEE